MWRSWILTAREVIPCLLAVASLCACAEGTRVDESGTELNARWTPDAGRLGTGPAPGVGSGGALVTASSGGGPPLATSSGGGPPEANGPNCGAGLKVCGGICVSPGPAIGCALEGCTPCPTVEVGGTAECQDGACQIDCFDGYTLSDGECITAASCANGTLDNAETDLDCGGELCPACDTGKACAQDADCAKGPCVGGICACTPITCADSDSCATDADDGCGGTIDCSNGCEPGALCLDEVCCMPATECAKGSCGLAADDGCGGTFDCSDACPTGEVCRNGRCCVPTATTCPPGVCGGVSDGCGGTVDCADSCASGEVCFEDKCCTPETECPSDACGPVKDGCGGTIECGGTRCGLREVCFEGLCCRPSTACPSDQCGMVDDGCGSPIDCTNNCPRGDVCRDGSCCTPAECPADCGYLEDGCGGNACPSCNPGHVCFANRDCASGVCVVVCL